MAAARRRPTSRRGGVHVVEVPHAALLDEVRVTARRAGMSLEEFVDRGRRDELTDGRLRDLWLMVGPVLKEG